jgi:hypothetical protein
VKCADTVAAGSSGYDAGKLEGFLSAAGALFGHTGGPVLSLIKRSDAAKGFVLLPRAGSWSEPLAGWSRRGDWCAIMSAIHGTMKLSFTSP